MLYLYSNNLHWAQTMQIGIYLQQGVCQEKENSPTRRRSMRPILFTLIFCISLLYLYEGISNAVCRIGNREKRFIDVAYPALSALSIVALMLTEEI